MKPIYKSVILTQAVLAVSLSLQANVYSGEATATQDVPAESLQGLRVQLVSPNVSGARDLIASGECAIDGATLNVNLNASGLIPGTHRLVVKAEYGTQTVVLYGLDITVPASFEEGDAQEFEDTITVVSTIGDGGESTVVDTEITENSQNPVTSAAIYAALAEKQPIGGYADGAVYTKDEDDNNAHITTPLKVSGGVLEGVGTIAHQSDQHVCGQYNVVDEDDSYAFIVGNGTDDEHRSNAFAITKSGNLVLFDNGTPVILTPAKLATLIA